MDIDTIIQGDALTTLKTLQSESAGLVVTSPPYNIRNSTGNGFKGNNRKSNWKHAKLQQGYDTTTDDMPHEKYVAWQREILIECMRVLNPTGAIFYNHKWRVQGGLLQTREDIVSGFPVRQIIIWDRGAGNNFNAGYFHPTFEVVYLITKPDFVLANGGNCFADIWRFRPDSDNPHPAPFPLAFAERCIMSTDAEIILDPFMGSGTVALAAKKLGRHYIGCDISPVYVKQAIEALGKPTTHPLWET